jgi:hypothetical protein
VPFESFGIKSYASVVGGGFALLQVNGFGNAWHVPVELEQASRKAQGVWFWKVPLPPQSCGMPVVGLQRRVFGTHSPVHEPLPVHTNGQRFSDCQEPAELHTCGTPFSVGLQRRLPGTHSPVHAPLPLQRKGQRV